MGQHHKLKPQWPPFLALVALAAFALATPITAQSLRQPSDAMVAAQLLKARNGNARDQYLLGLMYERGYGLPQDYTQAAHWYGEAARQGHAQAELSLGNLYDKGLGVPQSYETAYRWYRQAAQAGNGQAMYFVGSMLYNGDGIAADREQAASWFQRSMAAGFAPAKAAYERVRGEMQGSTAAPAKPPAAAIMPKLRTAAPMPATMPAPPAAKAKPGRTSSASRKDGDEPPAGVYAVQIGSFPDRGMAQNQWDRLKHKLPPELSGSEAVIYHKTLKDGRQVYRLNAGASAQKAEARTLCAQLKARRIDCLVIHY